MDKPIINSFPLFTNNMHLQKYERYLPSAFDESLSILQKLNKVIIELNQIGAASDHVIDQWNQVMDWVLSDGLTQSVDGQLAEWQTDGTLATIINQQIFSDLNTSINQRSLNVKDAPYKAKGDGVTDDTAAIQQALNDAQTLGGKVLLPVGTYLVSSLNIYNYTHLEGQGKKSVIKSINNNTNLAVLKFAINNNSFAILNDFYVDGNKDNQSQSVDGILFDTNNSGIDYDHHNLIKDVYVKNCSGTGLNVPNAQRESRFVHIICRDNNGHGFHFGANASDNFIEKCTAAGSGLHGFFIESSNFIMNTCKSFWAGQVDSTNYGDGFYFGNPSQSGYYPAFGTQVVNLSAQENGRHGFYLYRCRGGVFDALVADCNGRVNTNACGLVVNESQNNKIDGAVENRDGLNGMHKIALQILSDDSINNEIKLAVLNDSNETVLMKLIDSAVNVTNHVIINGMNLGHANLFSNPELTQDSNNDGIADGFSDVVDDSTEVSHHTYIDWYQGADVLEMTTSSASGNDKGASLNIENIPVLNNQRLSFQFVSKLTNTNNCYFIFQVAFLDNSLNFMSQYNSSSFTNGEFKTITLNGITVPNDGYAQIKLKIINRYPSQTSALYLKHFEFAKG